MTVSRAEFPSRPPLRPEIFEDDVNPEKALVGYGFRCWMHGLNSGDLSSLELCWNQFAGALCAKRAKGVVSDLSCWVKSLRASAGRILKVFPAHCPGFCRDECLAISMIAAGQNDVCPAMRACAYALLESNALDEPMETGLVFAKTLRKAMPLSKLPLTHCLLKQKKSKALSPPLTKAQLNLKVPTASMTQARYNDHVEDQVNQRASEVSSEVRRIRELLGLAV